ncbi:glycosyltransferase [Methanosarcina horonobensis]|uniref:glycosyltransferase n=1 Tax=Methanosarcina horonobensis TaxID=418008 RepID=UPI000AABFDF8|nr:glycosyltransferase family 2 protein [Methanosarcina horonobensis]
MHIKKEYPSIARYSILQHPYRRKGVSKFIGSENYLAIGTGHTLLKRNAIIDVGGFPDLKAKEDVDLTYRIVKAGYVLVHVEDCEVYHLHATTFRGFMKKYERDINAGLDGNKGDDRGSSSAISFLVSNSFIYPTGLALYGIIKDRDLAWFWHPLVCSAKLAIVARSFFEA